MEIISQVHPSDPELGLISPTTRAMLAYEPETYQHFLQLYQDEIDAFIFQRTNRKWTKRSGAEGVQDIFDWQLVRQEHFKAFEKQRRKYHVYKERVYFYTTSGIEVCPYRLNTNEIVELLNDYSQPPLPLITRLRNALRARLFVPE